MTTKKIVIGGLILVTLSLILIFWKPIWGFITGKKDDLDFGFQLGGNIPAVLNAVHARYASSDITEKGIGAYVDVPLTTIIGNKKGTPVNLQNMMGSISYNGEAILQTKADSNALKNIPVPAKGQAPASVTDSVQVLINPSSVKYFTEFINGNKPEVKYNFTAMVLGKPQSFTNTTIINKTI